jgi:hypothetical protein
LAARALTAAKTMVEARLAVASGPSSRGETSQRSRPATLPLARTRFIMRRRVSGSRPRACGELTPGAQADETTSAQIVSMMRSAEARKRSISG